MSCKNQGNSFVVTGRGGLPPTPEQQLDDDAEWQDRRRLSVAQQTNPAREARSQGSAVRSQKLDRPIIEATGWQASPTGEVILVVTTPEPTCYLQRQAVNRLKDNQLPYLAWCNSANSFALMLYRY